MSDMMRRGLVEGLIGKGRVSGVRGFGTDQNNPVTPAVARCNLKRGG